MKDKKNNRTKKADREYYEYEDNTFYGLKDITNLFNKNDDNDEIYDEIKFLFNKEIKKDVNVIHQVIKKEEVVQL